MKNIFKALTLTLAILGVTNSIKAAQITATVNAGQMINLLSLGPNLGSISVKQFSVTATSGTNVCQFVDTPTNSLVYLTQPYTNIVSYATNGVLVWTNFYGVVQSNNIVGGITLTNWWLVDVTNSVPSFTNNYAVRAVIAVGPSAPLTILSSAFGPNFNQFYFDNGLWVTNSAPTGVVSNTAIVTITY